VKIVSPGPKPIFLHSGWRTGSTYLWAKFRSLPTTYCYFEPLSEDLAALTPLILDAFVPWPGARHPKLSAPYLEEFRPLLGKDLGIAGYFVEFAYDLYLADRFAQLPKLKSYFHYLIENAYRHSRIPVFGCVRTSLRLAWFQQNIPGVHIFLSRSSRGQFISYLRQAAHQNPYFIERIWVILGANRDHPAFAPLRQFISIPEFDGRPEHRDAFYAKYARQADRNELYYIFYYQHLLTMKTINENCHAFLDIDRLSRDPRSARAAEFEIESLTGLRISLSDCAVETYDARLERSAPLFAKIEEAVERLASDGFKKSE
jgi:hypothetical protein